ncbi:hypothetical protein AHF37_04852 [Paragonimus kellicotti]|nr:hypothetical protein AHF37_04852 [Paragonimus kellicotti]
MLELNWLGVLASWPHILRPVVQLCQTDTWSNKRYCYIIIPHRCLYLFPLLDRIVTEHSAYEALRQEMNSMINEFHSI